ncbi:hypothetical protein [Streptomyces sp. NPDC047043]|uniref:hypothetical protein n=1 Tax=Streptomyces sp. NPDC047043 TaxID=3154497 RepID=UPI0033C749A7
MACCAARLGDPVIPVRQAVIAPLDQLAGDPAKLGVPRLNWRTSDRRDLVPDSGHLRREKLALVTDLLYGLPVWPFTGGVVGRPAAARPPESPQSRVIPFAQ